MSLPTVAPGTFAEGWSVTFPLSHDSSTVCFVLPSIAFLWVESAAFPPPIPPEEPHFHHTALAGGTETEDVAMGECDVAESYATIDGSSGSSNHPATAFQPTQQDSSYSPSTGSGFGPSISVDLRTVCLKKICSKQGNRMVRQIHFNKNRNAPYFWEASVDKIAEPPLLHISCEPEVGDVFIHEVESQGLQVWVLDVVSGQQAHWEPVYSVHRRKHPNDSTLLLSFPTPIGPPGKRAPTWVKESTAKRHKAHLPKILIN